MRRTISTNGGSGKKFSPEAVMRRWKATRFRKVLLADYASSILSEREMRERYDLVSKQHKRDPRYRSYLDGAVRISLEHRGKIATPDYHFLLKGKI